MTHEIDPPYQRYLCIVCGFIYDEAEGDPDGGLPPGTRYDDIPDDWECPDCGVTKADFVLIEAPDDAAEAEDSSSVAPTTLGSANHPEQLVVLGGGMAAWGVIEQIRRTRPELPIVMITHCNGDVYPKPQLSAAAARGVTPDGLVTASGEQQARRLNVQLIARTRVLGIERQQKRIITPRGGIAYSQLILALGAHQPKPDIAGDGADQIRQINDLGSYRALRQRIDGQSATDVVILGAGLIGCEFADDLSSAGHRITLIDNAAYPLARLLPEAIAQKLAERLTGKGVNFHLNTTLASVERQADEPDSLKLTLGNGVTLPADTLISALGLSPNIALARDAGLKVNKGIVVDDQLRTSDPDIYALGDCVEYQARLLPYVKPLNQQANVLAEQFGDQTARYNGEPYTIMIKTPCWPLAVHVSDEPGTWVEQESDADGMTFIYLSEDERITGFALAGEHASRRNQMEQKLV